MTGSSLGSVLVAPDGRHRYPIGQSVLVIVAGSVILVGEVTPGRPLGSSVVEDVCLETLLGRRVRESRGEFRTQD